MKSPVSLEIWAGLVWFAVGTTASLITFGIDLPPVPGVVALAEIILCGPLAVWLAMLSARALAAGEWEGIKGAFPAAMPDVYWGFMLCSCVLSACFLSMFVRGFLSLSLLL